MDLVVKPIERTSRLAHWAKSLAHAGRFVKYCRIFGRVALNLRELIFLSVIRQVEIKTDSS